MTGNEPERGPEGGDEPRPRRPRGGDEPPGARQRRRKEGELSERLAGVFDRLVEWLEGRGDDELAKAIREDAGAMTGGLVSATRFLAQLRGPLLVALAIVEPLIGFARVGRILAGRLADRRARTADERQAKYVAELQAIANDPEHPGRADALAALEQLRG